VIPRSLRDDHSDEELRQGILQARAECFELMAGCMRVNDRLFGETMPDPQSPAVERFFSGEQSS